MTSVPDFAKKLVNTGEGTISVSPHIYQLSEERPTEQGAVPAQTAMQSIGTQHLAKAYSVYQKAKFPRQRKLRFTTMEEVKDEASLANAINHGIGGGATARATKTIKFGQGMKDITTDLLTGTTTNTTFNYFTIIEKGMTGSYHTITIQCTMDGRDINSMATGQVISVRNMSSNVRRMNNNYRGGRSRAQRGNRGNRGNRGRGGRGRGRGRGRGQRGRY